MFKTRAEDSNKVLLTGPSEISRTLESTIFQKAGLDGSGVGVGIFHNRVGVVCMRVFKLPTCHLICNTRQG